MTLPQVSLPKPFYVEFQPNSEANWGEKGSTFCLKFLRMGLGYTVCDPNNLTATHKIKSWAALFFAITIWSPLTLIGMLLYQVSNHQKTYDKVIEALRLKSISKTDPEPIPPNPTKPITDPVIPSVIDPNPNKIIPTVPPGGIDPDKQLSKLGEKPDPLNPPLVTVPPLDGEKSVVKQEELSSVFPEDISGLKGEGYKKVVGNFISKLDKGSILYSLFNKTDKDDKSWLLEQLTQKQFTALCKEPKELDDYSLILSYQSINPLRTYEERLRIILEEGNRAGQKFSISDLQIFLEGQEAKINFKVYEYFQRLKDPEPQTKIRENSHLDRMLAKIGQVCECQHIPKIFNDLTKRLEFFASLNSNHVGIFMQSLIKDNTNNLGYKSDGFRIAFESFWSLYEWHEPELLETLAKFITTKEALAVVLKAIPKEPQELRSKILSHLFVGIPVFTGPRIYAKEEIKYILGMQIDLIRKDPLISPFYDEIVSVKV